MGAGRATARTGGALWRGMWWLLFPPLGWYLSRQAQRRRRYNAQARAMARIEVRQQEQTEVAKAAARAQVRRPCAAC